MEPEEHLRRRTSAAKDIPIGGPEGRLDREPPLKRQFDHANDSNRPLEQAQEDPAKARAMERVNERAQRFEGTSLAESPVLTNEFEKVSAKRASHGGSREGQDRRPNTPDRDAVLRAAMERAQSPKKQPTSTQAREIKPEFNRVSAGLQRNHERSGDKQAEQIKPDREQVLSAAFERASKARTAKVQKQDQPGSQMVRDDQPKPLAHPSRELREQPDRKSYQSRLMDEMKRELLRNGSETGRDQHGESRDDRKQNPGADMSR